MLNYARFDFRLRRRALLGWSLVLSAIIALTVWSWGEEEELQRLYEELFKQFPEELMKLFGKGVPEVLGAEAFYVLNYFAWIYIVILGAYLAFVGAGAVVDDLLERTGPLNLSLPLSRRDLLLARFLSIAVLVLGLTVASLLATFLFAALMGVEELIGRNIVLLHLHAIPYLLLCVSVGMLLGTVLPPALAKPVSAGLVVLDYVMDTMSMGTALEPLGYLTASRYFPALEIATKGTVSALDLGVLSALVAIALFLAMLIYEGKDMPI